MLLPNIKRTFGIEICQRFFVGGDTIPSILIFLLFALGLICIIRGGDRFVDASVWMASASRIPPFIIGATVVSLATTLPEIIVSLIAAWQGQTDMATGNAVGSVTANTALILSFSVLLRPEPIDRTRLMPKALLQIAAALTLWLSGISGWLTPFGCVGMLILFGLFVYENLRSAKSERRSDITSSVTVNRNTLLRNILIFVIGAGEIIIGSRLLVDNGTLIARDILHIDERIVSLTMVAIGTSLPELVTAISAVVKRSGSLAVGNILGANIIDLLLILPLCALTQGGILPLSRSTLWIDIPFCLLITGIMLAPALIKRRFYRWQGAVSLLLHLLYTILLFAF